MCFGTQRVLWKENGNIEARSILCHDFAFQYKFILISSSAFCTIFRHFSRSLEPPPPSRWLICTAADIAHEFKLSEESSDSFVTSIGFFPLFNIFLVMCDVRYKTIVAYHNQTRTNKSITTLYSLNLTAFEINEKKERKKLDWLNSNFLKSCTIHYFTWMK